MTIGDWRKRGKTVAFSLVTLCICLALLELSMIVLEPHLFRGFFRYDPDIGFAVRPHARGSNRFGFNDRDYPLEKDARVFRILVLGDSFSWAGGLKKNYTEMLERKFERHHGKGGVEVINAGYPMTHTAEQLKVLEKYGLQYDPDLVFLGFFMGNDFLDADPHRKRIVVNDVYFDIDARREITILGYPIVLKSRLHYFIKQKYRILKESIKARKDAETGEKPAGRGKSVSFSEKTFLRIEKGRLNFFHVEKHRSGKFAGRLAYIFESIDRMKELLDARNIEFVVGIYPDEFQVSEDLLDRILSEHGAKREDYDLALGQKLLIRHLESRHIGYVDMLPEFVAEGRERALYIPRNTHWNRAGNALAAEIIYRELSEYVQDPPKDGPGLPTGD